MSASRGGHATPARHRVGGARGEAGALMMFVLMAILLVGAVTLTVMQIIGADVGGGVEELEADQVFNVAQAGVHYAIGQLQLTGTAVNYTGGTLTITSGTTTLGTATITVNCIDTTPSNGWAPPCASSASPGYRRIISTGTLPVSGPSRTIVAVVQGTSSGGGSSGYGYCSLGSITGDVTSPEVINNYADFAANGTITFTAGISMLGDPGSPQKYTGKLMSNSTITCPAGCSAAGGIFQNQSGTLCTAPPLPTFAPGPTPLTLAAGTTFTLDGTSGHGYTWGNVLLNPAPSEPYTTLAIQTGAVGTTTVVQLNTLDMQSPAGSGGYARLMILGSGNVDLRIGAPTGESFKVGTNSSRIHFGVGPSDTYAAPAPLASASQLTVWVNSNGVGGLDCGVNCASFFSHAAGAGTIIVPNGDCAMDEFDVSRSDGPFHGAAICKNMELSAATTFYQDTSGLQALSGSYSNFTQLMSWKDQ